MGSEAEEPESSSIPKLPLFSIPPAPSPEHPGMLTPPFQTSLSVPFRWEEEPGKPRPCTALAKLSNLSTDLGPMCLELPPRLLLETKLSSPTTVLEGPYVGRPRFQSSSFRMSSECYGSFSPEKGPLGAMVLSRRGFKVNRGWFGSWRRRAFLKSGSKEVSGGSYVFPTTGVDREIDNGGVGERKSGRAEVKMTRIKRGGSFSSLTYPRSHFWATIYDGLKQAVPWKNRKLKKGL